jgi:hypothetical protein
MNDVLNNAICIFAITEIRMLTGGEIHLTFYFLPINLDFIRKERRKNEEKNFNASGNFAVFGLHYGGHGCSHSPNEVASHNDE